MRHQCDLVFLQKLMFVTEESDTDTFCQSWTCLAGMSGYALSLAKKAPISLST